MRKSRITRTLAATIALLAAPLPATASVQFLPVTPYRAFNNSPGHTADSPFSVGTPSTFYLEDFEDKDLDEPGVSVTPSSGTDIHFVGPGGAIDSVDGDDGDFDNNGNRGHSLYIGPSGDPAGPSTTTFTFDAGVLGQYPTHVGIVFTDIGNSTNAESQGLGGLVNGIGYLTFEAFDPLGVSLGSIGPVKVGDYVKAGSTGEDRFFGVIDLDGISKITISMDSHDAELDHLQYGFNAAVTGEAPEPASVLVWTCLGLAAAARLRTR